MSNLVKVGDVWFRPSAVVGVHRSCPLYVTDPLHVVISLEHGDRLMVPAKDEDAAAIMCERIFAAVRDHG